MIETEMRRNFYCYSCTNATEKCYRKEIGCPCGKYKSYKDENVELKEKLDKIRNYLVYDIFDRFKYLENLLKIIQETQEELSKRILEQQKAIGSLTDKIDEIKAYCKAVDEVNDYPKCVGSHCKEKHPCKQII